MKIVFFGTPEYVLSLLEKLHKKFCSKDGKSPIISVVTQPPKPVGRKKFLKHSEVSNWAYKRGIPAYFDSQKLVENKVKADLGIVASYGEIIPKKVIDYFPHGILNIHFSELPKLRGASPIPSSIISGEKEIGITIFKIDEKLDHGLIISQFREEILPNDTTGSIRTRIFPRAAEVLVNLLPAFIQGKITLRKQDDSKATYTKTIKKEDAFIPPEFVQNALEGKMSKNKWKINFIKDFEIDPSPSVLERFIRAMQPWPVAWTSVKLFEKNLTKRLKILSSHLEDFQGKTILILDRVQLEGKNPVSWQQFKQGYPKAKFV